MGPPSCPPQKGAQLPPNLRRMSIVAKCCMDQCVTWYGGRPQPMAHCARGDPAPTIKIRGIPQFLTNAYCGQTAGWIKTPLGTIVGRGPCNIVLDPAPPVHHGAQPPPNFRPMSVVAKRLDGRRRHLVRRLYGLGLGPGHFVLHGDPAPPPTGA